MLKNCLIQIIFLMQQSQCTTIHNLEKNDCINAIKELNRVVKNKKKIYIQVEFLY